MKISRIFIIDRKATGNSVSIINLLAPKTQDVTSSFVFWAFSFYGKLQKNMGKCKWRYSKR